MYFSSGGELVDIVNTRSLSPRQVLRVFYETCQAIAHMHSQTPPIIHRDIKVGVTLLLFIMYIVTCTCTHKSYSIYCM